MAPTRERGYPPCPPPSALRPPPPAALYFISALWAQDYPTDFNQDENLNVANKSANADVVTLLSARLRTRFP